MSTIQAIQITLDTTSMVALKEQGYALYVLRAVTANNAGAKALVWWTMTDFQQNVRVELASDYQAYVKMGGGGGGTTIDASYSIDVSLGDVLTVVFDTSPSVAPGGYPQGVTVLNGTSDPLVAGLGAGPSGGPLQPFVSAPLNGLGGDIFAPQDSFLVTFSMAGLHGGDVLNTSMSQSLLVDMTGLEVAEASFDINKGWNFGGAPWGQAIAAGTNLQKVLVNAMPLTRRAS